MQADIIAVGWKNVDFAFKESACQCEFMRIAVATQVAGDKNLELFVAGAQFLDKFCEGAQASGVMPEQSIEYGKVIQAELHGLADGGIACAWIKASDVQVGNVQQGCKQFLFWHDGLPG
ncbi:hypothetical protein ASE26_09740 [Duganella sp. Root198D2]|nr:hypothetical protein ASD07_03065 [Duganella sp. Root336D2]KRB84333.1 hypothetical protein ASE26_09740 [Duganella sp. Root198D2]